MEGSNRKIAALFHKGHVVKENHICMYTFLYCLHVYVKRKVHTSGILSILL